MANVIKIKKSSESGKVPVSTDLTQGELAINTADQKLYSYDGSSVFELTYTAGTNVAISGSNVISSTDTNTTYDSSDFLPATGGTLTGNLDVTGSITAYDSSSTANPRLAVGRSTNENLEFSVEDLNGKIIYKQDSDTNASHNLIFDIDAAGTGSKAFQFKLGGTEKLEINSTGLDVTGTVTADGLTFGSNHRIQGTGGLFLGGSSATVFEVGAGSEKMRLTSTGLGIGEPSPITPLHIDKVGGAIIHLADDAATADGAKLGGISSGNSVESFYAGINFFRHDSNDGEIRFRHKVAGSNTDVMTLVDGKVGIGSSSPGYKLEIATDTNSTVNLLLLRNSDSTYSQTFGFQLDTNKDLVITGSSGSGGVHFNAGSRGYLFDGGNISISSGNLTLSGTVDGRDVATDGTKLDTIATSANNYSLPEATDTVRGGIELFSNTEQSIAANPINENGTLGIPGSENRIAIRWDAFAVLLGKSLSDTNTTEVQNLLETEITYNGETRELQDVSDSGGINISDMIDVLRFVTGLEYNAYLSDFVAGYLTGTALWEDITVEVDSQDVHIVNPRVYGIQLNSDGQAVVHVPWTQYNLVRASEDWRGGINLFDDAEQTTSATAVSTTASRTYGLQLNSDGQGVVNVPWTDTDNNTTYSAGTNMTLSGTTFSSTDTNTWRSISDSTSTTSSTVSASQTAVKSAYDNVPSHTHSYQAADADLLAIGGLTGTSGYLKKTAADTWTLDTSTFAASSHTHSYLPLTGTADDSDLLGGYNWDDGLNVNIRSDSVYYSAGTDANDMRRLGFGYYARSAANSNFPVSYGAIHNFENYPGTTGDGSQYIHQLLFEHPGNNIHVRSSGGNGTTWGSWSKIWHAGNDGTGSGLDADKLDGVEGSGYAISSHTHSYLPLTGGTLTGDLQATGLYVGSTNTSFDFYNNGTSYLNGSVTIDDNLAISGTVDGRDVATDGTKLDTIATSANNYSHPTSAGNKHVPTGGASGQFLKYSSSGTATWATPSYTTNTNTTYDSSDFLPATGGTLSGTLNVSTNLNGLTDVNDVTNTSNGHHDIFLFGAKSDSLAQGGSYYNKLHIKGGDNQSRDLELYQVVSGYATLGTSWSGNYLDIQTFDRVRFNQKAYIGSTELWNNSGVINSALYTNTTYSAGTNMTLSGTVFSSTDTNTTYSAGKGMSLSGTTFNYASGRINYADCSGWVVSTNSTQPCFSGTFGLNGDGNKIVQGDAPDGRPSKLWQTRSNDEASNADGGWGKNISGLESDDCAYMSVVYVRRVGTSTNGSFYHGCDGGHTLNMNNTANTNPYFKSFNISTLPQDVWCVSIGYIHANNSTLTSSSQGGMYRLDTGAKVTSYTDYKMKDGSTEQSHRTYLYYSTDPAASLDWWGAGFYEINGNEPTISELTYGVVAGENRSKVWHAGNDGPSSGLDADLLDGVQGSGYAISSHTHSYLPLSGGSMTGNITRYSTANSTWPYVFATTGVGNDNTSGFWVSSVGYPDMRLRKDSGTVTALISSWETSFVSNGFTVTGNIAVSGTVDGRDVATDGTKLDTIETSATADQTASQIKTLLENGIDSVHYVNGSIDNEHIADNAINSEHYANGSIDNEHIADNAINSEHYAAGSIDNEHIADNAINSEHYAAGSIDNEHIADNAINSEHYAADSIDTEHYASGSVDTTALGADCVTAAKIGNDVINSEHYAAGSIDNEHIADNAINSEHYAAGSIDNEHIADDAINSEHYAAGSIDRAHLAADIIDGTKIANGVINTEHYVAGSIDNEHISDNAINSEHYADNSIDALHLNVSGNGSTSQFLRSDADGSFTWATPTDTDTNTTYSAGTNMTLTGTVFSSTDTNTTYSVQDGGLTQKNFTTTLKNKLDGISTSANNYSHPTSAGNKHIPTGGSVNNILINTASGTATWQSWTSAGASHTHNMDDLLECSMIGANTQLGSTTPLVNRTTGDYNTGFGAAVFDKLTTGMGNTAMGMSSSEEITSGSDNVTIGIDAGTYNMTGSGNVYLGNNAGRQQWNGYSDGNYNVAIGRSPQYYDGCDGQISIGYNSNWYGRAKWGVSIGYESGKKSKGTNNIYLGYWAGYGHSSYTPDYSVGIGSYAAQSARYDGNVFIGYESGRYAYWTYNTVAVGYQTLRNTSGTYCSALGYRAGYSITSGNNNTVLGANAGYLSPALTTGSNNTLVGYSSTMLSGTNSNEFTLGNGSVSNLRCNDTSISSLSDERDKAEIEDLPDSAGLELINKLRPITYYWDRREWYDSGVTPDGSMIKRDYRSWKSNSGQRQGFIAQEVEVAISGHKSLEDSQVVSGTVDKKEFAPQHLLTNAIKAIQQLSAENKDLLARIETLENA